MSNLDSSFTVHAYQGGDDLVVMQQALAGWISEAGDCGYCHVGDLPHRIYNGLRGRYPRHEVIRLWKRDDHLVGFAMVYPRHHEFDIEISPQHRGRALEYEALRWSYATVRSWMDREDAADKDVMADADSCDDQRINCLLELGFQPEESPWMIRNERPLTTGLPAVDLPDGFTIRAAKDESDADQLAAVHHGAFGSDWTGLLYRDEVMRKPGYDPTLEHIVVAPDGTFAAFCITWLDITNKVGLFEPVGTHEAYQRLGLGRALMAYGLHLMQERGMRTAQVCTHTENLAARALYQAMGFEPKYSITGYHKRRTVDNF